MSGALPRSQLLGLLAILSGGAILALRAADAIDPRTATILGILPLALVVLGLVSKMRSLKNARRHPAYRAYSKRMAIAAGAYVSCIGIAIGLLPDDAPATLLVIAIALIPGLAVLGMIWALGRLLIELDDEYLRLLEVRKFIVATGVLLSVASVWGLLELLSNVPRMPVFYAFPIWCIGLVAGTFYNRMTMDGDGGCA
jgi:hypothetical protein